ncbi:MAG: DUF882 domain-containing protein [Hyphomicrobiaceae bacterium]
MDRSNIGSRGRLCMGARVYSRRFRLLVRAGVAALLISAGLAKASYAREADRTLSIYNIHTKETATVVYKRGGKFDPAGLEKINHIMRDYRQNEPTRMDPDLIDLIWTLHNELGSQEPVHLISGYRSPKTNAMLRRTVGGQAKQSRHMLGKAADIQFPDVPIKKLRYSALIRERGGVGYYPTSAIPFVHVDTDRVRSWPRLPRQELALLFPSGATKHMPATGGAITQGDVRIARANNASLAQQIALFLDERGTGRSGVAVADARNRVPPMPARIAALPQGISPAEPTLIERSRPAVLPARLSPPMAPSANDRARLSELASYASMGAIPQLVSGPRLATRRSSERTMESLASMGFPAPGGLLRPASVGAGRERQVAAIDGNALANSTMSDINRFAMGGWIAAPAYDEEHPEELSYRPFPIAPYLTETAEQPVMQELVAHDVGHTVEMLDQPDRAPVLRFRPTAATASLLWAQQFTGSAIGINKLRSAQAADAPLPSGIALRNRSVKTSQR